MGHANRYLPVAVDDCSFLLQLRLRERKQLSQCYLDALRAYEAALDASDPLRVHETWQRFTQVDDAVQHFDCHHRLLITVLAHHRARNDPAYWWSHGHADELRHACH